MDFLTIGTPNRVRLLGTVKELAKVVTFLSAVLGLPVAATEAYKNYGEATKAFAEADWLRVQFVEKAADLHAKNKIPRKVVEDKALWSEGVLRQIPAARQVIEPKPVILEFKKPSK